MILVKKEVKELYEGDNITSLLVYVEKSISQATYKII